jgi:hypothetical protein
MSLVIIMDFAIMRTVLVYRIESIALNSVGVLAKTARINFLAAAVWLVMKGVSVDSKERIATLKFAFAVNHVPTLRWCNSFTPQPHFKNSLSPSPSSALCSASSPESESSKMRSSVFTQERS